MKLFVYEYVSCQPGEWPSSLRREGSAMLEAILADAARLSGLAVITMTAGQVAAPPGVAVRQVERGHDEELLFRELAADAEVTLVIAPETGGLLRARHDWVVQSGSSWLGCAGAAIDLAADKLALARHLHDAGVPTPPARLLGEAASRADFYPLVHKPRDGAGSQATFLARDERELAAGRARLRAEGWDGPAIVQPFASGQAASVALLVGPVQIVPLVPAWQLLSEDGCFTYLGGRLPLPASEAERASRLALRAVRSVPGLLGYVGVDLVLGAADDGSLDQVIEINPRLTTSYVGLRALSSVNLFEALWQIARGTGQPTVSWREGSVRFDAAGGVDFRIAGLTPRGSPR